MPTSLFLFTCCTFLLVADVQCDERSRQKRSDDHPALEPVVSGLSQQLTQMGAQLTALQNTVAQQQQQHDQLKAKFDSAQKMVAFTASNSQGRFSVATQGIVINNMAPVNLGGAYDTLTGVFTCPTPGLYIFFINCEASSSLDVASRILVDGTSVAVCYAHATWDQGANMAAVHLKAGQKVWVKMDRDARDLHGVLVNTFSGFLVRSED